jgi:exodeoxyribonuclease VII small subunit
MKKFESRLERLEELAGKIGEQDIPLDEAIKVFEEGIKLSRELKKELDAMQGKVEILLSDAEEEGEARTAPFGEGD